MKTRKLKLKLKLLLILGIAAVALAIMPIASWASNILPPMYEWYTADPDANTFTLDNRREFAAFANLVNGKADVDGDEIPDYPARTFTGKTVELSDNVELNDNFAFYAGDKVDPVGGQGGALFNGLFDGNGKTVYNFSVDTTGITQNLGLFGHTGPDSVIRDLTIGSSASLTKELTGADAAAIKNAGLLVGYSEGRIENCVNNGRVEVSHSVNQSASLVHPIQNIGGLAGQALGDIVNCTNNGKVIVSETGFPYQAAEGEDWADTTVVALNIGGVAGCAGTVDTSNGGPENIVHGTVTACANTGDIEINTPNENGYDRFGNQLYANSANVGGVLGYSRGSVSKARNEGYVNATNGIAIGGIVGGLRNAAEKSMSNFSGTGGDDGTADDPLSITESFNSGHVQGRAVVGGISGRAGSYTTIWSCINNAETYIVGTRPNKPFPAGIVGITYGKVAYCANLGTVASGEFNGVGLTRTGGGYYAAGIAGGTHYWLDADLARSSPLPEVYGCYNAGMILAADSYRQRHIVGNNDGYCHDNIAVQGRCPGSGDKLVYGDEPGDSGSSGTSSGNYLVREDELKSNTAIAAAAPATPLSLLNAFGNKDGWVYYWARPSGGLNDGYPVLNTQASGNTDISSATVSLARNAPYTGLAAVPQATVTLGGLTLVQGIDFRVEPEADATEVTASEQTPYTAHIVAIGSTYTGTATQTLAYGIEKGDLAECAVLIDTLPFNWLAQTPAAQHVHVYNLAGGEVNPNEYSFALDPNDPELSALEGGGKGAVNAKNYDIIVTATAESGYFQGSGRGEFIITGAKILWSDDDIDDSVNAHPNRIAYAGQEFDWKSSVFTLNTPDSELWTAEYTGYPVKPEITSLTYQGRELDPGDIQSGDYYTVYGETMTGKLFDNIGVKGGADDGYLTAIYVPGGNFANQDNMKFRIVDTAAKNDIAGARIKGDEDIIFEPGSVYRPIELWYGGSQLTEGIDYQIAYTDNDKLGLASYAVTGVGDNFEGSLIGTFAITNGTPYALEYSYDEGAKTAELTGGTYFGKNPSFAVIIPEKVEKDGVTYTVTSIATNAFGNSVSNNVSASGLKISKVTIPGTVKAIGAYAFGAATSSAYFKQLKEVVFAGNSMLETIGESAFRGTGIREIVIPKDVTTIGNRAFQACADLKKVTFLSRDAGKPAIPSVSGATTAFAGVTDVDAYGYDEATGIRSFVETNYASSLGWTWTSLGSAPPKTGAPGSGDFDGDGVVTAIDAGIAFRASIGSVELTAEQLAALDVDQDGALTTVDSSNVFRLSIGLPALGF